MTQTKSNRICTAHRVVSASIFNPRNALFKSGKSSRAKCTVIRCSLEQCPLLDVGTCMLRGFLSATRCPYGKLSHEAGPTTRAQRFSTWIREREEKYAGVKGLRQPTTKMALVGEHIYLPYAHMTMCAAVPFLAHGNIIASGACLLKKTDWTLENIERLLAFRPQALMGGEIAGYQKEQIPRFLLHLRETDPAMWTCLIDKHPELDVAPDHVGRKALLSTLAYPIGWTTKTKYPVAWKWDGTHLHTESPNAYYGIWGEVKAASIELRITPADDTEVEVQDNSWVLPETVFID